MSDRLIVKYLGRISYEEGLQRQQEAWQQRVTGASPDVLLLLEHDSVFTMGRRKSEDNMLVAESLLGAPLVHCDRGGEMTYHGPGQLVGYFHAKLSELDGGIGVRDLIYRLEEVLRLFLYREYGIEAWRDAEHRGVWVGNPNKGKAKNAVKIAAKIAALGISIKQGVSMHGFALNITTDLNFFRQIIPCGIVGKGVSSLEQELRQKSSLECPAGFLAEPDFLALPKLAGRLPQYFRQLFHYKEVV